MDHVLPKAVQEAALRPLFDWAEKNSDKFFVRRTTALVVVLAENIALRQAMLVLGMPPLGVAVRGLSDVVCCVFCAGGLAARLLVNALHLLLEHHVQ